MLEPKLLELQYLLVNLRANLLFRQHLTHQLLLPHRESSLEFLKLLCRPHHRGNCVC